MINMTETNMNNISNIDVRVLTLYQNISNIKEHTATMICDLDPDHGPLFANLGDDDRAYFYCLGCNYRLYPGLSTYAMLCSKLKEWGFDVEHN
jgi:hypothetical protein